MAFLSLYIYTLSDNPHNQIYKYIIFNKYLKYINIFPG